MKRLIIAAALAVSFCVGAQAQVGMIVVGQPIKGSFCRYWLNQLFTMSPVPAIQVEKPL